MKLKCISCSGEYNPSQPVWRCGCGGLLDLEFRAGFPVEEIARRPPGIWRYREALPIGKNGDIVSFGEGFTPLVQRDFDGRPVFFKLENLFPSGSFKDRGASVLVSKMKELGVERAVEDSSGNAGAAVAAYCAAAGIACDIYIPRRASKRKILQIEAVGASVHRVPGSREDVAAAALRAAEGGYYASHSWNPFFFHGTKTFAFEVAEQLGWRAPDLLVLPVGNGTLLLGAYIGLRELSDAGLIDRLPVIVGVQAENCAPLAEAWGAGRTAVSERNWSRTIAEGISVAKPVRAGQIIRAVEACGGRFVSVGETEIEDAIRWLASRGFYVEPTAAVALAGYKKLETDARVVVIPLTGHGLKAVS